MKSPVVHIVDDDREVRESIGWLLKSVQLSVEVHESGSAFLSALVADQPGCVILDMRLPGLGGLQVLEALAARCPAPPAILYTAYGTVATATRAMRAGAVHVLEKPCDTQLLLDTVNEALVRDRRTREQCARRDQAQERLSALTEREHEVLARLVSGESNKQVARSLDISARSVEFHRANLMNKLEVESFSELVLLYLTATLDPTAVGHSINS